MTMFCQHSLCRRIWSHNVEEHTLVRPPFGTEIMNENISNHHVFGSTNVSLNCARFHCLVWVVRWNFFGRKEASFLSVGVRKWALDGESGK